jgi:hypothetical protein
MSSLSITWSSRPYSKLLLPLPRICPIQLGTRPAVRSETRHPFSKGPFSALPVRPVFHNSADPARRKKPRVSAARRQMEAEVPYHFSPFLCDTVDQRHPRISSGYQPELDRLSRTKIRRCPASLCNSYTTRWVCCHHHHPLKHPLTNDLTYGITWHPNVPPKYLSPWPVHAPGKIETNQHTPSSLAPYSHASPRKT